MPAYVIVLPLEPLTAGASFHRSAWPLHVTVMANFRTEASPRDIVDTMTSAAAGERPIWVTASGTAHFGPLSDIEVALLEQPDAVTWLHRMLLEALSALRITLEVPPYSGSGFRPHITASAHGRANDGDRFLLRQLALAEMDADVDDPVWTVRATMPLT